MRLKKFFKQELDKRIAKIEVMVKEQRDMQNRPNKSIAELKLSHDLLTKELNLLRNTQKKMANDLNVNSREKVFNFNLQNVSTFFNNTTKQFR